MSSNPSRGYLYVVCGSQAYYDEACRSMQSLLAIHPWVPETWRVEASFRLPFFGDPALLRRLSRALKLWFHNPFPGDTLLIEITRR